MARQFSAIDETQRRFIAAQKIFFTATCAAGARVNVSPRSTDHLHVLDACSVAYFDLTGSGSETAAHVRADGRMTIMFCAFEGAPLILRLYGQARIAPRGTRGYAAFLKTHYDGVEPVGGRQAVFLDIDLVQTSCGYGVPFFDHAGDRTGLSDWAERKGETGLRDYRTAKNTHSIDGLPTGYREG